MNENTVQQMPLELPPIYLSASDAEQLKSLVLQTPRGEVRERLEDELSRAEILSTHAFPSDIVKLNSLVRFVDLESGQKKELALVLPGQANIREGRISVLAPVGIALLGLSVGQSISWPMPEGRTRTLKILEVFAAKRQEHPP
ncbi:MAG TPA: nucleoside diphosphate kinase regulator [bacterium]|nr:nucleoside diphosphate kinase regulator [bacterium]